MRRFSGIFAIIALVAVWEIVCRAFNVPAYLLPSPGAVAVSVEEFGDNWWGHIFATLSTVLAGFAFALAIGIPIAVTLARSNIAYRAIYPLLVIKQSIPIVAMAPIIIVVIGPGFVAKTIVACIVAIFPIIVSTATGLMATPPEFLELARSVRQDERRELFRIRFPFAVRYIFSGIRLSVTLSVIGAVVSEFVSAGNGLGYLVYSSMAFLRTPLAFGALAMLAAIGVSLFYSVGLVQRVFFPWASDAAALDDEAG